MSTASTITDAGSLTTLTAQITAAYLSNHSVSPDQIVGIVNTTFRALAGLGSDASQPALSAAEDLKPAVPIKRSVTPDYIVCLEDGRKVKMLKRHLRSAYSLTPDQYRKRWGLPADYPMVAPNYAAERSEHAKRIGLGKNHKK